MPVPSTAINRLDLSLTFSEFSSELTRRGFIGHMIFPPLMVNEQASTYRYLGAAAVMPPVEDDRRAPKATYKRDDYEWSTDSYATEEHGVEEVTDDRQLKMYGEVNAEAINRDRAIHRVAQSYEVKCATLAFDTAYFTGAYTGAVTDSGYGGYIWTNKAQANPIADIDKARAVFKANAGVYPNALVIEEAALLNLIRTSRIEDVVKYTGTLDTLTMRKLVPQLKDLLRIDKIITTDSALKNTAGRGQTPVMSNIWPSDKALLCRVNDGPDLEPIDGPFLGRTIMWAEEAGDLPGSEADGGIGIIVEEYREEARRGGVIRARTDYVVKRIYKPAGFLLTGLA